MQTKQYNTQFYYHLIILLCYEKHSKYKNIFKFLLKNVFLRCSMQFKLHLLQMGVTRTLYPIWLGLLKIKNNYNDEKTSCETRCPYDLVHFTHRRSGVSAIFPMQPATYSSYGFVSYDFIIQSYENIFNHFTKNLQKTFLIKRIEYYNIFLIFLFTIFLLKSTILFISIYYSENI